MISQTCFYIELFRIKAERFENTSRSICASPHHPITPSPHHPISLSPHRMKKPASRVFDRSKGLKTLERFLQKINLHCVKLLSTIPSVKKSIGYRLLFVMIIFMICQILRLNTLHLPLKLVNKLKMVCKIVWHGVCKHTRVDIKNS